MAKYQPFSNTIEAQLNGTDWVSISSDVLPPFSVEYGILDADRNIRLGRIGTMKLVLDNSHTNSSKTQGRYSPHHSNAVAGFEVGTPIRWLTNIDPPSSDFWKFEFTFPINIVGLTRPRYKFQGRIADIYPAPDAYGDQTVEVLVEDWFREASEATITTLPALADKTIDQAIPEYVALVTEQPASQDISSGVSVLGFIGQGAGFETRVLSELQNLANSEPSYIYMRAGNSSDGGMVLVVENQNSRDTDVISPTYTLDKNMIGIKVAERRQDVVNRLQLTVNPVELSTDEIQILNINYEIGIKAGRQATLGGSWSDSDGNSISAYDIDTNFTYEWYSVYEYPDYRYANWQVHCTNIVPDRIKQYTTDIVFWFSLSENTTNMHHYLDTNVPIGTLTGAMDTYVTDKGYGGVPYRQNNKASDFADINTTDLWAVGQGEQGAILMCINAPMQADTGSATTIFQGAMGAGASPASDYGQVLWYFNEWSGYSDASFRFSMFKNPGTDSMACVFPNYVYDSSVNDGWVQLLVTWDMKWGSTDNAVCDIYVDGVAGISAQSSDNDPHLQHYRGNPKNVASDLTFYEMVLGQNGTNALIGYSHWVYFDRYMQASDAVYLATPSTNAGDGKFTPSLGGQGWEFDVTAPADYVGRLYNVQIYGKEITALEKTTVQFIDTDSIKQYGESTYLLDMPYQQYTSDIADVGFDMLQALKSPRPNIDGLVFIANLNKTLANAFLDVEGGHEVNIIEGMTGIGSDSYIVNGVRYTVYPPDLIHVEWIVYPR